MSGKQTPRCSDQKRRTDGSDESATSTANPDAIDSSHSLDLEKGTSNVPDDPDGKKVVVDTKEASFQYKLYEILQCEDFKEILTWLPHGRSWKIFDSEALAKCVLPKYFRHCMYSSFKRQMSGWGFRRGIKVNEYNEYSHPLFMRDKPELLSKMKRRMQKRNAKVKPVATNNMNLGEGKMPGTISVPGQAESSLRMTDINQTNLMMNLGTNDNISALPIEHALMRLLQNQSRSELLGAVGLYANANQLATYHQLYPGVGLLDWPHNNQTQLNIFQQSSDPTLPLRIPFHGTGTTIQPSILDSSQSGNSNIQMSDYMNRLASNQLSTWTALDQLTRLSSRNNSLLESMSTPGLAPTYNNFQRLEQLAQLEQRYERLRNLNSLAMFGSNLTAPFNSFPDIGLAQSDSTSNNVQLINYLNGIQGPSNPDVDTLENVTRAVSSMRPPTQNDPANFQGNSCAPMMPTTKMPRTLPEKERIQGQTKSIEVSKLLLGSL